MNIYLSTAWLLAGVAVLLYGAVIFKGKRFGMIFCIGKSRVSDKDGFSDSFGKAVAFLGGVTGAASVLCRGDSEYLPASLVLTGLSAAYFVLESFHLVKLYGKKNN